MKSSKFIHLTMLCSLVACFTLNAQLTDAQRKTQILDAQSISVPKAGFGAQTATPSSGDNQDITTSDAGMQRPIFLQTKNLSFFAGVDNSISRKANPLLLATEADIDSSGGHDFTWSRSVSAGLMSNPFDIDFAMLSFVGGGAWTKTTHLIDAFRDLDDFSTSAYALAMIQHESGWSYRLGSTYAMVRDIARTESYSEFYPNIGVSKSIDLGYDITGILDISGGKHLTTSDSLAVDDKDTMENWDFAFSFGLRYQIWDFLLSPSYRYSKKVFTTDNSASITTFNRVDYSNTLSLKIDYSITDNFSVGASYSFDQRDSNVASNYKSWSADANMGLSLSF
jgi:hypothetical protein